MTSSKTPHLGEHAAHLGIDSPEGGAKTGVITDYIGDEESGIVVIRDHSGHEEGFDRREVRVYHGIPLISQGPVITHPRHLLKVMTRPLGLLAVLLALVIAGGLVDISHRGHWAPAVTALVGVLLVVVTVGLVLADQAMLRNQYQRQQQK